eukprot:CAMPEP_0184371026 /NCGR_PEP_ID=MMETSP1089-20130417/163167_1 /TAXON_ID=38269 ORGANISM="Gloeochaete wittrockiana, Strain SAG46.84" /NCGR_SAMPLE_ID=MMETSP1089 /ASSEMBLY_ACC=CAM_ASM_000445 /LENGTH=223 /DNA_ID=CAMNT_0026713729 /DNA_START=59 /DNA_END=731 /DNA_ORIENTATION=+
MRGGGARPFHTAGVFDNNLHVPNVTGEDGMGWDGMGLVVMVVVLIIAIAHCTAQPLCARAYPSQCRVAPTLWTTPRGGIENPLRGIIATIQRHTSRRGLTAHIANGTNVLQGGRVAVRLVGEKVTAASDYAALHKQNAHTSFTHCSITNHTSVVPYSWVHSLDSRTPVVIQDGDPAGEGKSRCAGGVAVGAEGNGIADDVAESRLRLLVHHVQPKLTTLINVS